MGTCSKCGRAESKTVPLAFIWDVWKYKEVCRYGCKDRVGSPLEVAYCLSCGKAVELCDTRPHICGPCFAGVPKDSAVEKLYAYAGKPLTPVLAPAPKVRTPVVEAKQDELRICNSGTVAVGRCFRDRADNIWQVMAVGSMCFTANIFQCVEKIRDMRDSDVAFLVRSGKWCRDDYSKPFAYDFVEWVALPKSSQPAKPKTDVWAIRKDYLAVEIDERAGTLKIVKQRNQKQDAHSADDIYRFKASNGITLESRVYPEYVPHDKTLYLRGYETSHDADVIRIPIPHIPDILQAVVEYNEYWGKKNV